MPASVPTPAAMLKQASGLCIAWGVLLVIFGGVAISSPFVAAVAVNALIAWLIILAGCVHAMLAFRAHAAMGVLWKLLIGAAYVAIGLYLFWHPLLGVASLTLLLGCLFVVEGVLGVVLYFQMRPLTGVTWTLLDGLVTLLLGLLIWIGWPSSSAWVIGTLVGISMIMSGLTRVMLSLAVRRIVNQAA